MYAKLRTWIIYKLGGFPDIDAAIEEIKVKDREEKYRILTLAVKKFFNTINEDDILQVHPTGAWLYMGKTLGKDDIQQLCAEANIFINSRLFKVLETDIRYQTNRKMYILGKSDMDFTAGKLWIYTFEALKTRLKSMQAGHGQFNHQEKH